MKRESYAPLIIAIALLLLPVLYAGSYLALVKPGSEYGLDFDSTNYRWRLSAERFFWPLEQIDRNLRPAAWGLDYERARANHHRGRSARQPLTQKPDATEWEIRLTNSVHLYKIAGGDCALTSLPPWSCGDLIIDILVRT